MLKKATLASVWGDSDSDDEEESQGANLVLTEFIEEVNKSQISANMEIVLCLIAGSTAHLVTQR